MGYIQFMGIKILIIITFSFIISCTAKIPSNYITIKADSGVVYNIDKQLVHKFSMNFIQQFVIRADGHTGKYLAPYPNFIITINKVSLTNKDTALTTEFHDNHLTLNIEPSSNLNQSDNEIYFMQETLRLLSKAIQSRDRTL